MSALSLKDYVGMSADTGAAITGEDHLVQSLRDLITTPKGTRVGRRTYGTDVPYLVDAPMNPGIVADVVASVAEAVILWEPRVSLSRVIVMSEGPGRLQLRLVETDGNVIAVGGVGA